MKRGSLLSVFIIAFLLGSLASYILTQFEFLEIDKKVNVPASLISLTTAIIGLYIAISISKKNAQSSNKYTFVQSKVDLLWQSFNSFSLSILYSDKITVASVSQFTKEAYHSISYIKNIFLSQNIHPKELDALELKIEALQTLIEALPVKRNVYQKSSPSKNIESHLNNINICFSSLLKVLDKL